MKKKRKKIIVIITLILIILLALFIYNNVSIEKGNEEYQDYTPQEEISEEQMRQTKVILYFANSETGELESETKIVDANLLINEPYKEIMNWLIKGPQSSNLKKLIPEGTSMHDIKVEKLAQEASIPLISLKPDKNDYLKIFTHQKSLNSAKLSDFSNSKPFDWNGIELFFTE